MNSYFTCHWTQFDQVHCVFTMILFECLLSVIWFLSDSFFFLVDESDSQSVEYSLRWCCCCCFCLWSMCGHCTIQTSTQNTYRREFSRMARTYFMLHVCELQRSIEKYIKRITCICCGISRLHNFELIWIYLDRLKENFWSINRAEAFDFWCEMVKIWEVNFVMVSKRTN